MANPGKSHQDAVVSNLADLLKNGNAHVSLDKALKNVPFSLLGQKPGNGPHSIWQLADHIRIAQWDLLEFSRNPKHKSPEWPEGYWPKESAPASESQWLKCVEQIMSDRDAFVELIEQAGEKLFEVFKHGTGQTLLKEALVLADHNSYHAGQIVLLRKMLHNWD